MTDLTKVEYRVVETKRFVVTRYHEIADSAGSETKGEFHNAEVAYEVAYALCKDEHDRLGWPVGDDRIQYPKGDPRYPVEIVGAA